MSTIDDKINEHFAGFVVRQDLVKAVDRSTLDGTPLGLGEMDVWDDSIPRVL